MIDLITQIIASLWGYLFRGHPVVGATSVTVVLAVIIFIATFVLAKNYESQHPQNMFVKNEIEFLSPYQAASPATPAGGVNVAIWWIPVKLGAGQEKDIPHATVRARLHNAHLINHDENQKLWWIDKQKRFNPEITLVPGHVHRISFVSRRGDKDWYAVLVEETSSTYPELRPETVKLPAGDTAKTYTLTVTVLASGKELGSQTYNVHVPPKGEHNTRFWISTPELDNQ